jgi:hypothetical protein
MIPKIVLNGKEFIIPGGTARERLRATVLLSRDMPYADGKARRIQMSALAWEQFDQLFPLNSRRYWHGMFLMLKRAPDYAQAWGLSLEDMYFKMFEGFSISARRAACGVADPAND